MYMWMMVYHVAAVVSVLALVLVAAVHMNVIDVMMSMTMTM